MGKRNSGNFLIKAGAVVGVGWLLSRLFRKPDLSSLAGLDKLIPGANRRFFGYEDKNKKQVFRYNLLEFSKDERDEIFELINKGALQIDRKNDYFSPLKYGSKLWELRDKPLKEGWRILMYPINESDFVMFTCSKKKKDKIPRDEKERAERRLQDYLSQSKRR